MFRFHSDRVLFSLLIGMIFFKVLSDRFFFGSSVIGSSSGPAIIDSSPGSSVLFFGLVAIFFTKS